jgi:hypothetical protein
VHVLASWNCRMLHHALVPLTGEAGGEACRPDRGRYGATRPRRRWNLNSECRFNAALAGIK